MLFLSFLVYSLSLSFILSLIISYSFLQLIQFLIIASVLDETSIKVYVPVCFFNGSLTR